MEPGPGEYEPKDPTVKPPSQAKKSPGFLSSAMRSDKMATKFFTGNFVSNDELVEVFSVLFHVCECRFTQIYDIVLKYECV